METWKAECWLGSNIGIQTLEVEASSSIGAKEQLKRIYGASKITDLRLSKSSDDSSLNSEDKEVFAWVALIGFILYLLVTYWYITIPISVLILIFSGFGTKIH